MKTQEILTRINAAMAIIAKDEQYAVPGTVYGELSFLARDLEAQIRMECAAQKGSTDATRTITKMLNYAKKHDYRESLHYAWSDSQGRQCVADGYRAFRFKEPLPLEPRPENAGEAFDLEKVMPDGKGYASTPLPSAKEIRAHIEIERAKYTGKRGGFVALWDFGEGKPVVNAHYLLDLVQVFPDAAEIFYGVGEKLLSPLYVKCDAGDAILLPVRASRVVAEVAAARKAKEDAEQVIKAQAEAEGHDPEYIREREERRAKRKAAAKKALDDNLQHIRMEMALSENYALELDEFEYLVFLMDEVAKVA